MKKRMLANYSASNEVGKIRQMQLLVYLLMLLNISLFITLLIVMMHR